MPAYKLDLKTMNSRVDLLPEDRYTATPLLHLIRMRLSGDYDVAGNYWGKSAQAGDMYCATWESDDLSIQDVRLFVRGHNRLEAKQNILKTIPNARFYR